jgi:hypothetical protein
VSLSTCEKCGGHIPLGPDATNCCEKCGTPVLGKPAPTFAASLVNLGTQAQVPRAAALSTNVDAVELRKMDMAIALAKFFIPLITETKDADNINLRLGITMVVPTEQVPPGTAHTKIIFQEAPHE